MITLEAVDSTNAPIYQRIAAALRKAVHSGELGPGQRLPAMSSLAKSLGVSPLTVGRSYSLLESDGIVVQKQGSGTYVRAGATRPSEAAQARPVRRLFVVLNADCLAKLPRETLHITTDLIGGFLDVLDARQTHVIYVESFTQACLGELGADDAVVVRSPHGADPHLVTKLLDDQVRMVTVWDAYLSLPGLPGVEHDVHQPTQLACAHLVECGYQRIGYIGRLKHHYLKLPVNPKFSMYAATLQAHGLDVHARHVRDAGITPGQAYRAAREIIESGDLPDAFFVDTDYKAMEVIAALADAGLRVPEDVGIASYDDVPEAATFTPALTTVRIPRREMGQAAARLLLQWPTDGSLPASTTIDAQLMIRQTTRPFRANPTAAQPRADLMTQEGKSHV